MVDIGNVGGGAPIVRTPVPARQAAPLPSLAKAPAVTSFDVPVEAPATETKVTFAEVQQASQIVASNPYPISDQRFAIFKDIAGDYVTRFTSLVDGSVEYFPQKSLFELVQVLKGKIIASTVDTQA